MKSFSPTYKVKINLDIEIEGEGLKGEVNQLI